MPRSARIIEPDGVYHIVCRGNNRAKIFYDQDDFVAFLNIIWSCKKEFDYKLFHYVLLPNHFHLLVQPDTQTELAAVMKFINQRTAAYYKIRRDHVGRVFQDRYYSSLVADDAYLLVSGIYIELNPCRAAIVSDPVLYPWSSARHYLLGDINPLVDDDPLVLSLAADAVSRQKEYWRLIHSWMEK